MHSKNLAIATMSMTGVVLLCTLMLTSSWQGNEAYARGMLDRGGDYIVGTLSATTDMEVLVIIDGEQNRLNLYKLDPGTNRLQFADQIRLDDQLFGTGGGPARTGREQPRAGEREPRAPRPKK